MNPTLPRELPVSDDVPSLYDRLEIPYDASQEDIAVAYHRLHQLYNPAEARRLGPDFVVAAEGGRAAVDEAYAVLSDPGRRFAYDRELGLVGDEAADRRGITNREVTYAVGGILIGLIILASLWAALGGSARSGPAVSEVNYAAPPIKLRTLDGDQFDLEDHRGKVVLVNFWATWCEPCKQETPALEAAYRKLADEGLVIVGVDLFDGERVQGRGEQDVKQFVDQYGVSYPIALDDTGQVARDFRLYPIPVSYFIDRDGAIRYIRIGGLTTADVEEIFRRL